MPRYFLEVSYKGTRYSGFQSQPNAVTIQEELEKGLQILFKQPFVLTGSSRTDAGVHALQNYFHFDADVTINDQRVYNLNAILPGDITVKSIRHMHHTAHARFDAIAREYRYFIYQSKNPFLDDRAWFYPYKVSLHQLNEAAGILLGTHDFTSFSKRNTQVNNFNCTIEIAEWYMEAGQLVFHVKGNRFLRGMVRGLVGTMLKVGREQISLQQFEQIIQAKDCTKADFTTPAHGLFLEAVHYPEHYFA